MEQDMDAARGCTAFAETRRIAAGALEEVARVAQAEVDAGRVRHVLLFDDLTAAHASVHEHGTAAEASARLRQAIAEEVPASRPAPLEAPVRPAGAVPGRPGRPRLGVIGREVTLLPRHWEWLGAQPGGASVALRKLVEKARRENADGDRVRRSQEAAYRFVAVMAGDEPGFVEAARCLFAGDADGFGRNTSGWPEDVRRYAATLAADALAGPPRPAYALAGPGGSGDAESGGGPAEAEDRRR